MLDESIDQLIARLSRSAEGVVRRDRLVGAGISGAAIDHRLRRGSLHTFVPRVYLVGHSALTPERIWWGAVCAGGGALTGRSWLEALGLLSPQPWKVEVVIPPTGKSRRITAGFAIGGRRIEITLRRGWEWPGEAQVHGPSGLPGVDVHHALARVAGVSEGDFLAALREAEFRRLVRDDRLAETPRKGRRGSGQVRARLEKRRIGSMIVRNGFEDDAIDLFARLGLPTPLTNVVVPTPLGPAEVDFLFPTLGTAGVAVEMDGSKGHGSLGGVMRDHEKDAKLRSAGIDPFHFNWWQASERPESVRAAFAGAGYLPRAA